MSNSLPKSSHARKKPPPPPPPPPPPGWELEKVAVWRERAFSEHFCD